MFKNQDVIDNILGLNDFEEQFKIIEKLTKSRAKNVDKETIKSFIQDLKSGKEPPIQVSFDEMPLNPDGGSLPPLSSSNSSSTTTEPVNNKKDIAQKDEEKSIENLKKDENTSKVVSEEKTAVLVKDLEAKHLNELKECKYKYEKTIKNLQDKIKTLENQATKHENNIDPTINPANQRLSKIIRDLNELLNSSSEKITVQINKELLSNATKFVDDHSLIRLENIIRQGNDLSSTIVQSVLLAFIHEKSLL